MSDAFFSPQLIEKTTSKLEEQQHKPGLYIVATPIGNIFDVTLRAIHILKKAKYVFAEDTRQSKKLLNFYDIKTHLVACHEHNEIDESVTSLIKKDEIYALISDAGTPMISDPGYRIINWCLERGVDVFPVPGACSFIAGLSAAGLSANHFLFYGFLPVKLLARKDALNRIKDTAATLVFLESPKRVVNSLRDMLEIFGDRYCCVCREITKIFEEFKRGKLSEVLSCFLEKEPIGEFVIIVSESEENVLDEKLIFSELGELLKNNSLKSSVSAIAGKYGISKSIIYEKALEIKHEDHAANRM